MKNVTYLAIATCMFLVVFSAVAYADIYPIHTVVLNSTGHIQNNTGVNYTWNFTENSDGTGVILSVNNSTTTNNYGNAFMPVDITDLTQAPSYLHEIRNGTSRVIHEIATGIFRNLWVDTINASEGYFLDLQGNAQPMTSVLQSIVEISDDSVVIDTNITLSATGGIVNATVYNEDYEGNIPLLIDKTVYLLQDKSNVTLTTGTWASPTRNYIYIVNSSGNAQMTASTTYPTGEFAWLGIVELGNATGSDFECFAMQDEVPKLYELTKLTYERAWVAKPLYESGIGMTFIGEEMNSSEGTMKFALTTVNFTERNTSANTKFIWVNDPDGAMSKHDSLDTINKYEDGGSIGNNKYFNVVVYGVVEDEKNDYYYIKVQNTASPEYTSAILAEGDAQRATIYSMPTLFTRTGFNMARVVLQHTGVDSNTIQTLQSGENYINLLDEDVFYFGGSGGGGTTANNYWAVQGAWMFPNTTAGAEENINVTQIEANGTYTNTKPDDDAILLENPLLNTDFRIGTAFDATCNEDYMILSKKNVGLGHSIMNTSDLGIQNTCPRRWRPSGFSNTDASIMVMSKANTQSDDGAYCIDDGSDGGACFWYDGSGEDIFIDNRRNQPNADIAFRVNDTIVVLNLTSHEYHILDGDLQLDGDPNRMLYFGDTAGDNARIFANSVDLFNAILMNGGGDNFYFTEAGFSHTFREQNNNILSLYRDNTGSDYTSVATTTDSFTMTANSLTTGAVLKLITASANAVGLHINGITATGILIDATTINGIDILDFTNTGITLNANSSQDILLGTGTSTDGIDFSGATLTHGFLMPDAANGINQIVPTAHLHITAGASVTEMMRLEDAAAGSGWLWDTANAWQTYISGGTASPWTFEQMMTDWDMGDLVNASRHTLLCPQTGATIATGWEFPLNVEENYVYTKWVVSDDADVAQDMYLWMDYALDSPAVAGNQVQWDVDVWATRECDDLTTPFYQTTLSIIDPVTDSINCHHETVDMGVMIPANTVLRGDTIHFRVDRKILPDEDYQDNVWLMHMRPYKKEISQGLQAPQ